MSSAPHHHHHHHGLNLINNVCISDVLTGDIIFERVYKWKETSAFSNLGSLIQIFYQFAREIDDGGMLNVSM
jgi:hypothetical protein